VGHGGRTGAARGTAPVTGIRLVVCDMDGTLLLDDGAIPDAFWPLLAQMTARGIEFVPASGRQLATLRGLFGEEGGSSMSFIAENGTVVTHGNALVSTTTVADDFARSVVLAVRAAVSDGADLGVVVCRADGAVVERTDAPFVAECAKYYVRLDAVDDALAYCHDVVKLAVFDFGDATATAQTYFGGLAEQVVVSGRHWIDIMSRQADKGVGVRVLQRILAVGPEQTAAFGDYLNDLEMRAAAQHSFAVANAHPAVAAAAGVQIPSNVEQGVITTLRELLADREGPASPVPDQ